MAEKQLLTTNEAAEVLSVHRDTVYALWHRGEFKRTKAAPGAANGGNRHER